jgi:hypothetical protein
MTKSAKKFDINNISNMTELRALMIKNLSEVDAGTANLQQVDQFTKLSGQIISSVLVEVRAAKVTHNIAFLK